MLCKCSIKKNNFTATNKKIGLSNDLHMKTSHISQWLWIIGWIKSWYWHVKLVLATISGRGEGFLESTCSITMCMFQRSGRVNNVLEIRGLYLLLGQACGNCFYLCCIWKSTEASRLRFSAVSNGSCFCIFHQKLALSSHNVGDYLEYDSIFVKTLNVTRVHVGSNFWDLSGLMGILFKGAGTENNLLIRNLYIYWPWFGTLKFEPGQVTSKGNLMDSYGPAVSPVNWFSLHLV